MPIETKYFFEVSMDIDADKENLFNEVYDEEHVPFISTVPGVRAITRAKAEDFTVSIGGNDLPMPAGGVARYVAIYEIDSPDVLASAEWAVQAEKGRWATEVRPHTKNRGHAVRKVIG
ncbi:MAG: hypothetical protein VXZ99_17300 [Pseudomonadota bacterium]|nr:hypothetical protein [Pseudomonadota bacterium]